ncbi:MAG: FHA domain-containing protein, partial [Mycobacterium sp.]|nr:FHA domain-containing protein [Mycobacterium sp.]
MSRLALPVLTIRHDGSQRSFAAGHDVVVGRDLRADLRIADPRISRRHLILRFEQGRWLAIDNGSVNGTYLNGYRMPVIDIHDGQSIHVGNPEGPRLTFEVGRHLRKSGRPPGAGLVQDAEASTMTWSTHPERAPSRPQAARQTGPAVPRGSRRAPAPTTQPPPPRIPDHPTRLIRPSVPPPSETTVVDAAQQVPPAEVTVVDAASADVAN